jgi:hypothetical protein
LLGHNFVCIMAPHLGWKLRNAIAFTQTSKITHINTHIPRNAIKSCQKYKASLLKIIDNSLHFKLLDKMHF